MALIECHYFSNVLGMSMTFHAIVPQPAGAGQIGIASGEAREQYPVLYLFHGLSDDHSIWCRRTGLERYAAEHNLVVVMPNVHRSFYTDMKVGGNYFSHVADELPRLASHFLPVSTAREDSYVAGLSMGGYGAFKLALSRPEQYAAAASFSGAVDMMGLYDRWEGEQGAMMRAVFGTRDEFSGSENDLMALADRLAASDVPRPRLYQSCGTEDFLYEDNIAFRDHARNLGVELEYHERPGAHEWGFWDVEIEKTLRWLAIR
ncbi:MAG: alpha/beta hydrolase [Planctomycetota bacterium]|jgi:S-formylglutathione hydrolase FrmB